LRPRKSRLCRLSIIVSPLPDFTSQLATRSMHRPWPYPRVVGHRGGGTLAPDNTLAGIRKAAAMGFGGVEFDVMLSADKVPLLMHDETFDRTTNGKGSVAETPYARLASLDAGAWFSPVYRGERVPSFAEAGKLCAHLGLWANVEIKPARGFERETATAVAKLALELWSAPPAPLLSSFEPVSLDAARAAAPDLDRGYLTTASRRVGMKPRGRSVACPCIATASI